MYTHVSSVYMLQEDSSGNFFSSFDFFQKCAIAIPVLFGAKEFETEDEAYILKNSHEDILKGFSVVKRTSTVTIEKV